MANKGTTTIGYQDVLSKYLTGLNENYANFLTLTQNIRHNLLSMNERMVFAYVHQLTLSNSLKQGLLMDVSDNQEKMEEVARWLNHWHNNYTTHLFHMLMSVADVSIKQGHLLSGFLTRDHITGRTFPPPPGLAPPAYNAATLQQLIQQNAPVASPFAANQQLLAQPLHPAYPQLSSPHLLPNFSPGLCPASPDSTMPPPTVMTPGPDPQATLGGTTSQGDNALSHPVTAVLSPLPYSPVIHIHPGLAPHLGMATPQPMAVPATPDVGASPVMTPQPTPVMMEFPSPMAYNGLLNCVNAASAPS